MDYHKRLKKKDSDILEELLKKYPKNRMDAENQQRGSISENTTEREPITDDQTEKVYSNTSAK